MNFNSELELLFDGISHNQNDLASTFTFVWGMKLAFLL